MDQGRLFANYVDLGTIMHIVRSQIYPQTWVIKLYCVENMTDLPIGDSNMYLVVIICQKLFLRVLVNLRFLYVFANKFRHLSLLG